MNSKIRNLIVRLGFLFLPILVMCSCEDEPEPQYEIRVLAECDSQKPVCIYGLEKSYILFTHELDYTVNHIFDYGIIYDIAAYCEDPQGTMKITVWVNGEYSGEVEGHSRIYIKLLDNGTLDKGPGYLLTSQF